MARPRKNLLTDEQIIDRLPEDPGDVLLTGGIPGLGIKRTDSADPQVIARRGEYRWVLCGKLTGWRIHDLGEYPDIDPEAAVDLAAKIVDASGEGPAALTPEPEKSSQEAGSPQRLPLWANLMDDAEDAYKKEFRATFMKLMREQGRLDAAKAAKDKSPAFYKALLRCLEA